MKGTIRDIHEDGSRVDVEGEDGEIYSLFPGEVRTTRVPKPKKGAGKATSSEPSVVTADLTIEPKDLPELSKQERKAGKMQQIEYQVMIDRHVFDCGEEVSFTADQDLCVTWIAPKGSEPPPPSVQELLLEYLTSEDIGDVAETVTCRDKVMWTCPWCSRTQHFNAGNIAACSRCDRPFPSPDEFRRSWQRGDDNATLVFTPQRWECPKETCKCRQPWYLEPGKAAPPKCGKCDTLRPPSNSVAFEKRVDYGTKQAPDFCFCYTATGIRIVTLLDQKQLAGKEGHHAVQEVLDQGNQRYVEAKASYQNAGCPHCEVAFANGKGCHHNSLLPLQKLSFGQWYGLVDGDNRYVPRAAQLKRLLDGIPKCGCDDLHGGIGAVPKFPFNVFCIPTEAIDEGNKFWDGKATAAVTEKRPKYLKAFPVITGSNENMRCHITPRSAAGCFVNVKNVIWIQHLCGTCQCLDYLFTLWQGENASYDADNYAKRWHLDETKAKEIERNKEIDLLIALFNG